MYLATAQAPIYHMTYFQAVIIGLIQGFFELFPLSSLGHTVLVPSWIGGSWATLVRQEVLDFSENGKKTLDIEAPAGSSSRLASRYG